MVNETGVQKYAVPTRSGRLPPPWKRVQGSRFEPHNGPAARGESPAAFGRRCIPPGCVAPRSNTPGILTRRALPSGRIAALGATPDFHHGPLRVLELGEDGR